MKRATLFTLSIATILAGAQAFAADATGNIPPTPTSASMGQPGNSAQAKGDKDATGAGQAVTSPDEAAVFGNGPSNPKVGGPWSGKNPGKLEAGEGGYNANVPNPGNATREVKGDNIGAKPSVASQYTIEKSENRQGETFRRKGPQVGKGNTADNGRRDPVTGERTMSDREESSNPGNPNAPLAPGGSSTRATKVFHNTRGEMNSGAFADMNMPTTGGTPMDEMERSRALKLSFEPGKNTLSDESKKKIDDLLADARSKGNIDKVKVLAWADADTPQGKQKLPKDQVALAGDRAKAIESLVKEKSTDVSVDALNMAEKPGFIKGFVNTSDKRLLDQLKRSGLTRGNASQAMVMVVMKR